MGGAELLLAGALIGGVGMLASKAMGGPKIPDAPKPEKPIEKGDEGIRAGENLKADKRRTLGQVYLTRGQSRASDTSLGGLKQTLG